MPFETTPPRVSCTDEVGINGNRRAAATRRSSGSPRRSPLRVVDRGARHGDKAALEMRFQVLLRGVLYFAPWSSLRFSVLGGMPRPLVCSADPVRPVACERPLSLEVWPLVAFDGFNLLPVACPPLPSPL